MNNNQEQFNQNSQQNNIMTNSFNQNTNEPTLNVIPQNTNQSLENPTTILNTNIAFNKENEIHENNDDISNLINQQQNKFINNNIDTTTTTLNNLNVNGEYNNLPKVDYTRDPKVMKNIEQHKKNTITITSEGKIFIIIILVLLLFIFVLPTIFDIIGKIKYQ